MPTFLRTNGQDAMLADLTGADILHFCNAQPANYAGIAGASLASAPVTFSAPTLGSPNGRQVQINALTNIPVILGGHVLFLVLAKVGDATIRGVRPVPDQPVVAGGTVSMNAFLATVGDPA